METGETPKKGILGRRIRERRPTVTPEELDRILQGEHVLPHVRELFGQERDNTALPTLSTCPIEVTLPQKFNQRIAEMTQKTLKDTRERGCFGYLESDSDSLNDVHFHLEKKSKKFAYYLKRNDRMHMSHSIDDLVVKGVKVPLVAIHTHPDIFPPDWISIVSMEDIISFLDERPIPFNAISHPWGTTFLVKCQEFFKGSIYSFDDLWRSQLERLRKIRDYYRDNMGSSEQHSAQEDFLAALCGQYGIAYYTSNRFNESAQPLVEPKAVIFKRVNPWRRLNDLEEIEKKL